jgi:hypothetical protein
MPDRQTNKDRQFDRAEEAVSRAVVTIEKAVNKLLERTEGLEAVAIDFVVERLTQSLLERNPQVLDYLNKKRGSATVRLANALMDYRDNWVDR